MTRHNPADHPSQPPHITTGGIITILTNLAMIAATNHIKDHMSHHKHRRQQTKHNTQHKHRQNRHNTGNEHQQ